MLYGFVMSGLQLFVTLLSMIQICAFPADVFNPQFQFTTEGDINIGAILSIHNSEDGFTCSKKISSFRAIEYVEAIIFAINEINNSSEILPNIKLGNRILDDCFLSSMALSRAMQFMPNARTLQTTCRKDQCKGDNQADKLPQFFDVVGVLGAYTSSLSIVVANVMTLFKIPQISHTSTSDLLSDKKRFPYFLRVVPPDKNQVKAMAAVLDSFKWKYVSVVYSQGSYGQESQKKLIPILKNLDICVAQSIELTDEMGYSNYDDVIGRLRQFKSARVVVLYAEIKHVMAIMTAVKRKGASGEFIWTGSDALSLTLDEHPEICEYNLGTLTVWPYSAGTSKFSAYMNSNKRYIDYFQHTPDVRNTLNSWLSHNQSDRIHVTENHLALSENISDGGGKDYLPLFAASYLIDAVYAFAHALDHHIKDNCAHVPVNQLKTCVSGESLLPYLKKVTFQGSIGQISFDNNSDVVGKIEIRQCQMAKKVARHVAVGIWDMRSQKLDIHNDKLQWSKTKNVSTRTPTSFCAEACRVGEIYTFPKSTCCWKCVKCKYNEMTSSNSTRCEDCDELYWPDEVTRKTCHRIEPTFVRIHDPVAIVLCTFAILGLVSTGFVILFFHSFRQERVIRSSSRELSHMILVGILAAYLLVFSFLTFPNSFFCYLNHVGFSLTFTCLYAPLLVKTNRIYRIFRAGKKTTALPRCTSSSSQVAIVTSLLTVQIILVTVSTSMAPPQVLTRMPVRTQKFVELFCDMPFAGLLTSLSFNFILVTICTFYAFKTRRLPDNYNESRYIAFCVDTTLLVWISFIPTYFTTSRAYYRVVVSSIALIVNSTVSLLCLFIPKVHALYLQKKQGSASSDRSYNPLQVRKDAGLISNRCSASDFTSKSSCNLMVVPENNMTVISQINHSVPKKTQLVNKHGQESSPENSDLST